MKITSLANYINQPLLGACLHKKMPAFFIGSAALYGGYEALKSQRAKEVLNKTMVIASVVGFTLFGVKGLKIAGRQILKPNLNFEGIQEIKKAQNKAVELFLKGQKIIDKKLLEILEKAKNSHLSFKELEYLNNNLKNDKLLSVITGKTGNLTSKEIWREIDKITKLGAYSILGGLAGGLAADKITNAKGKKRTLDKVKEGSYQFFANMLLSNLGAGAGLYTLEKFSKNSTPLKKMGAVITGILLFGIAGGSIIVNYFSRKVLDPLFGIKKHKGDFYERKPELLDLALHIDDIATAGVLSGASWIAPLLPLIFAVSGYRTGIGYRNHHKFHISCLYAQRLAAKQFKFN